MKDLKVGDIGVISNDNELNPSCAGAEVIIDSIDLRVSYPLRVTLLSDIVLEDELLLKKGKSILLALDEFVPKEVSHSQ